MFLEVASLWAYRKENAPVQSLHEKNGAGLRSPLDAPIDAPTAPAGTV